MKRRRSPWLALVALALACGGPARESRVPEEGEGGRKIPPPATETPAATRSNSVSFASTIPPSPIPVGPADAAVGSPLALVTLVAFLDLECPFSARSHATLTELRREYGSEQLRLVVKHHPLPFHRQAKPAAVVAEVVHQWVGDQAFLEFVAWAYEDRKRLADESLRRRALEAGVPASAFSTDGVARATEKVEEDVRLAERIGASGTPAFFVNGRALPGAQPKEKFAALIEDELAAARAVREGGLPERHVYAVRSAANFVPPAPDKAPSSVAPDLTVWRVPVASDDPARGGKTPLVTIVEFGDFQCPFTKRVEPTLQALLERYGEDLRIVWKDSPLPFHPEARAAAALGRVAYAKGGDALFWRTYSSLFASQLGLRGDDLPKVAAQLGFSAREYERELTSPKFEAKLDESALLAVDFRARATPHFFVNGVRLLGAQPLVSFQEAIDVQVEQARVLMSRGVPRAQLYEEIMKGAKGAPPSLEKTLVGVVPQPAPARGSASAPITIVQFADFECPLCPQVDATLDRLLKKYPERVRIEWHDFPQTFHRHAALAAEAAHEVFLQQGSSGFFRYRDRLLSHGAELDRSTLEHLAATQGVDVVRLRKALDERTHRPRIEADVTLAGKTGLTDVPSVIVGGAYFVAGAEPLGVFERAVESALAASKR